MHGSEEGGGDDGRRACLRTVLSGHRNLPGCVVVSLYLFSTLFFLFDNLTGCLRCRVASLFSDFWGNGCPGLLGSLLFAIQILIAISGCILCTILVNLSPNAREPALPFYVCHNLPCHTSTVRHWMRMWLGLLIGNGLIRKAQALPRCLKVCISHGCSTRRASRVGREAAKRCGPYEVEWTFAKRIELKHTSREEARPLAGM